MANSSRCQTQAEHERADSSRWQNKRWRLVLEGAIGCAVEILELAGQRPDEAENPGHPATARPVSAMEAVMLSALPISRIAFGVTRIDEVDMAIAASSGVTNPAMASGTKTRL